MKDKMTFEEIKEIIELVRQVDSISDFMLKCGDVEISLSRGIGGQRPANPVATTPPPAPPLEIVPSDVQAKADPGPAEGEVTIRSPMVGTFYRSPKPGDPPFVEVGQTVQEDTVLCIIEVMKLMNSIEAKVTGVVTRILVEDARPVEHGQALMYVRAEGS